MGKDRTITYEFNIDEFGAGEFSEKDEQKLWEKKMEGQQKQNELIEKMSNLVVKEIQSDHSITIVDAFKRVINKTPDIARLAKQVEADLIKQTVKKMSAGEILNHLVNEKMKDRLNISYSEAFSEVQIENPEFTYVYAKEIET